MAEFCNLCHKEQGFPGEPGIDVYAKFEKLKDGEYMTGFLCEGCGLTHVANRNGRLRVMHLQTMWVDYPRTDEGSEDIHEIGGPKEDE